jgi:YbgC/YbaW family acyl-CoA thioester hydrolase
VSATLVSIERRVIMGDVDAMQVHYASHFRWFDAAFHELVAGLGHSISGIISSGYATPVVDAHCSYAVPVHVDDAIEVSAQIARAGRTSFAVRYRITCGGSEIANGETTHVWVALPDVTPEPLPEWLRLQAAAA